MSQTNTIQDHIIISELMRRAHAMGMKRRMLVTLLEHQLETERFVNGMGFTGIQEYGFIFSPNQMQFPPMKLPFELEPCRYSNRFFTVHREFYRDCPRYVMRIYIECSCRPIR